MIFSDLKMKYQETNEYSMKGGNETATLKNASLALEYSGIYRKADNVCENASRISLIKKTPITFRMRLNKLRGSILCS